MGQNGGSFGDDLLNVVTNAATGGLFSFKDGKFGMDGWLSEGFSELTGVNTAKDALFQQKQALDAEVQRREQELQDQLSQNERRDRQASNAGASRATTNSNFNPAINSAATAAMERDFLGL